MASISRASSKSLEEAEIFQVLEGKMKFDKKTIYKANKLYYSLQKIYGENDIIFISTIFSAPQIL